MGCAVKILKPWLTDAAAVLHVSQPSLSVALTRVEERLGRAIFARRKGAAIVVTPFGYHNINLNGNSARAQELKVVFYLYPEISLGKGRCQIA